MHTMVGILGLILGSFYNVVAYQLDVKKVCFRKRSTCPNCGTKLTPKDLIPVFSFALQKGKCRYCKKRISWVYPVIELYTSLSFISCYHISSSYLEFILLLLIVSLLVILSAIDLFHYILPNKFLIILAVFLLSYQWVFSNNLYKGIVRCISMLVIFMLLYQLIESKVGAGDLKYISILAIQFTLVEISWVLFISSLIAIIFLLITYWRYGLNLNSKIPFGPFLSMAATLVLLVGT